MSRVYTIGFARVSLDGLFDLDNDFLSTAWQPGMVSVRYGREWRISKSDPQNGVWFGRVGFVSPSEVSTLAFDDEANDFVEGFASGGVVVPFALDVERALVAYQLRGNVVRPRTFTGALEALLSTSANVKVTPLVFERTFKQWISTVSRVYAFRFKLEPPNPNYVDREKVRDLVEETEAEFVTLSARGQDLDTSADIFKQALAHVLKRYGRANVNGVDGHGEDSQWIATKELPGAVPAVRRIEYEADAIEAPMSVIAQALKSVALQMLEAPPPDPDSGDQIEW